MGLACLSPERRREISAMGGKKQPKWVLAHRWTKEEARKAGQKGGARNAKITKHPTNEK